MYCICRLVCVCVCHVNEWDVRCIDMCRFTQTCGLCKWCRRLPSSYGRGTVKETWKALEEAHSAGLTKAIGVSHFLQADLESLMKSVSITVTNAANAVRVAAWTAASTAATAATAAAAAANITTQCPSRCNMLPPQPPSRSSVRVPLANHHSAYASLCTVATSIVLAC